MRKRIRRTRRKEEAASQLGCVSTTTGETPEGNAFFKTLGGPLRWRGCRIPGEGTLRGGWKGTPKKKKAIVGGSDEAKLDFQLLEPSAKNEYSLLGKGRGDLKKKKNCLAGGRGKNAKVEKKGQVGSPLGVDTCPYRGGGKAITVSMAIIKRRNALRLDPDKASTHRRGK